MLVGSVALLGITLVFGNSGASRDTANQSWLMIPIINISIQPSEFVKITFICTFAKHLSAVKEKINHPKTLIGLALHAGAVVGLILLSGDLGVALVYISFIALMLFCNGLSLWYFLGAGVAIAIVSPFLWEHLSEYQRARIIYGFQPELDPTVYGFQPLLSRTAIANGGLFGKGVFGGSYYEVLPASHTDFIYATVCEKFGYVGGVLVMLTLIVMVVRLIAISLRARKQMGALICLGIAAVILVQTLENIGMCLAMLPVVGITLPFLSCGGSSMLATFILIGLAHSVASHNKKYYFEREND
jgi:rod shape determining protein RodA